MSRLSGRLSCTPDARNKRIFAGIMDHLNASNNDKRATNGNRPRVDVEENTKPFVRSQRGNRSTRASNRATNYSENGSRTNCEKSAVTTRTRKIEDIEQEEELFELDDIISQISDLNIRCDRSAAQIKRNIMNSNDLMESMDDEEWEKLCQVLINTAIEQGEYDFVVDLFISLIKNDQFCEVMSNELMTISSKFIMDNTEQPIPAFLSAILCAHWPRHLSKAIDTVNYILYTTVCIIKGWIQVIEDDNRLFHKPEASKNITQPPIDNGDEEEIAQNGTDKGDEPEYEDEQEDPLIVNKCAIALCELCETAQRQLWMKWPTICDEIYSVIKPAITHNSNLTGKTKNRLLSAYLSINTWTRSRTATTKTSCTQTVTN